MLIIRKSAFAIDDAGLRLGSVKLAKARQGVLQPYPAALDRLPDAANATVIRAIAAWNRGEKALALIALVHLGQPEVKPSKGRCGTDRKSGNYLNTDGKRQQGKAAPEVHIPLEQYLNMRDDND